MSSSENQTLLVIPAFRESKRLPNFLPHLCRSVAKMGTSQFTIRVVDDGSGASEQEFVTALCEDLRCEHPFLEPPLLLGRNLGKGGAVYAGWDAAGDQFDTIGFVDADGSISADEVVRVAKLIPELEKDECLYATRDHDQGGAHAVERTLMRKWLGLLFRRLTRTFLRLPVRDTQCGFKFVPAAAYRAIRGQLSERRYCFDIDLTIHLLQYGSKFREVPISWVECPGTRLGIPQAVRMLTSLWNLSRKARA